MRFMEKNVCLTKQATCVVMASEITSRAAAVLLSDPCFQLHSIQHLLGEPGDSSGSSAACRPAAASSGSSVAPSAAGNSSERKHFSLHACEFTNILVDQGWSWSMVPSEHLCVGCSFRVREPQRYYCSCSPGDFHRF
ncbi:hypothetical protein GOODEAATRI_011171 [Goodea atripinnis]|uniref:Uncharacterized protein n=1 Tax=Goodea atripinnis TaxID=208336 RepID=A0ABV0PN63_9TELE